MKYIELSLKKLREVSVDAAKVIKKDVNIDLIIYVARAGLPIAVYMNEVIDVSLLGIGAQRKGNKLKSVLGPVVAYLPRFVRDLVITFEIKSKVHMKDAERFVEFHKSIENLNCNDYQNILIVDDSVDTGNSMKLVYEKVKSKFPKANLVTYSLNVWNQSRSVFDTDYCSYEETVIKAPMSKDSKEYKKFCEMYEIETKKGYV